MNGAEDALDSADLVAEQMNRDELDIATRVLGQIFRNYLIELQTAGGVRPSRRCPDVPFANQSLLPGIGMGNGMTLPAPLGLADLRRTQALDLVDADDRVHRHEAAQNAFELRLELLLAGVHHHLGALAEDELLDFQEAPQIALVDLLGASRRPGPG